jgi:hypothetical protein
MLKRRRDRTTNEGHYATPSAFRLALTDRLKAMAEEGRWSLMQLQRQIAYDRLLERLHIFDDGWVVRGLDDALTVVRPGLDPLLDNSAEGSWQPLDGRWEA